MQVQLTSQPPLYSEATATTSTSTASLPRENPASSVQSASIPRPRSGIEVFFEDLGGFLRNLILWPIHGHQLIWYQIIFMIVFPILLPVILVAEIFRIFIEFITCSCCRTFLNLPKFELKPLCSAEYQSLKELVNWTPADSISEENQIQLVHILNTYVTFAKLYDTDLHRGKKHDHFNCLIKVKIGEQVKLFRYRPSTSKGTLVEQYLAFIKQHGNKGLYVQHTFVGLDYSYFIGIFNLKIKTDTVEFPITKGAAPLQEATLFSSVSRYWKKVRGLERDLFKADHQPKDDREDSSFNMWPGFTRNRCCDLINSSLETDHLHPYQISLANLDNMVQIV